MIKQLKKFTIQMLAGANIATVVVMLLVGYSDRLNPADHPLLSTMGITLPFFLLANLLFLFFWIVFKWRMVWIPVLGYLLAYVPISIYMPLNMVQDVPDGAIRLVSYNVCGYGGNYRYGDAVEMITRYLNEQEADIVCVQEDNDTWRRNVFRAFEKFLPYNDTIVIANNARSFNAVGIHTRYPILKRERIDYRSVANGSAVWWLKVGDDTLIVVNNHFESCHLDTADRRQYRQMIKGQMPRDSVQAESKLLLLKLAEANAIRSRQIRKVLRYVEEHRQYPMVVCGDFNDHPISYSRHAIGEVLTDCFKETGRGIGLSYNQRAFSLRIDHVFCSKDIQPYNCKIDGKMDASDHNPVLCWLKMRRKE